MSAKIYWIYSICGIFISSWNSVDESTRCEPKMIDVVERERIYAKIVLL